MTKRRNNGIGGDARHGLPAESGGAVAQDWARKFSIATAFGFGGLLVWAFLAPVDATSVFQGEALTQNLFWLILGGLSAASAIWGDGYVFNRKDIVLCCIALLWLIVISYMAGKGNNPRPAWHGFWQVIALTSCYFCARSCVAGLHSRTALVSICLVGCVALSFHGFYQVGFELQQARARYEQDPERELASISMVAPVGSPERQRFESRLYSPEPYGTFALANSLATLLSAGLILAVGAVASSVCTVRRSARMRMAVFAAVVGVIAIFGCWFLTLSRTAYLAVVAVIPYWLWLNRSRFRGRVFDARVIGFGGAAALVLLSTAIFWLMRNNALVLSEAFKSLTYRLEYWMATLSMIAEHGLFGVGLGNFQSFYPQYMLETASETIADPHNWFLDIAATLSLPSALFIAIWIARNLWGGKPAVDDDSSRAGQTLSVQEVASKAEVYDALTAKFLFWGAGIGGFLCFVLLVLLTGLDVGGVGMAWALAVGVGIAMQPAVRALMVWDPSIPRTAALAMVLCLLASGSWQASGLSVPFLVLMAVAHGEPRQTRVSEAPRYYLIALPLLSLVCFILQSWRPVSTSWASMQQVAVAKSVREQMLAVELAIRQDPLDTDLQAWSAQRQLQRAVEAPRSLFGEEVQTAIDGLETWLARDGNKYTNWREAGNLVLGVAAAADRLGLPREPLAAKAADYYQTAAEKYPSSVQLHLQLAAAAAFADKKGRIQAEIAEAVRLSQATSHADKKLENQLIWLPFTDVPETLRTDSPGWVAAEPLLDWLRTVERLPPNSSSKKSNN